MSYNSAMSIYIFRIEYKTGQIAQVIAASEEDALYLLSWDKKDAKILGEREIPAFLVEHALPQYQSAPF